MSENTPGIKKSRKCSLDLSTHQNTIKSLKRLYESEPLLEKLNSLLLHVDIIDIKSFLNIQVKETEKKLSMLESLQANKKKIWTNRLNLLNKNFLNTTLLKTLVQDSTLKEKDLSPFWIESSKEMSKKLWLPTKTDLQELDLNLFCTSVNSSIQNLPFSQIKSLETQKENLQKNLYPSLLIIPQNSTDSENTNLINNNEKNIYCRKIRFYPTEKQVGFLNQFFGTHRYLYNKTIAYFNNKKENDEFSCNLAHMRPKIMKNNKDIKDTDEDAWLKNVPYDTRQLSIKNALSSIKSSFELLKKGIIKKFKHSYKSKKENKQIFHVDHRALKNLELFPNLLKEHSKLKVEKRYKKYYDYVPQNDLIILKDGKKYFILYSKEKVFNKYEQKNKIISLDPGVKKFQSFYTPDGYCGSIGDENLKNKVLKIEKKIDNLKSLKSKTKDKKIKNRLKSKCYELTTKVKNIVNDFHWKISSFLTRNYKEILLPIFESSKMKKNLNNYTNRYLDILSHYKFKQKMIYQSKKYGSELKIVDESYSTKTCGNCGCMNHFVGNSNLFWCPYCKIELERDYQAARNILIKNK